MEISPQSSVTAPGRVRRILAKRMARPASLGTLLAVGLTFLVLWFVGQVVLLVFASGLFAIFLAVPAEWISRRTGLSYGLSLGAVLLVLVVALAGVVFELVPRVAAQVQQLETALPKDFQSLVQDLQNSAVGHLAVGQLKAAGSRLGSVVAGPVLSSLSSLAGAAGSIVFVVFMGIYLAAAPRRYEAGLLSLVPAHRTARAREIIEAVVSTLKYFLAGRLFSMALIALCSGLGLWALGVPAPVALALLAGVLSFVPYVGSAASGVPPFLLAYAVSPMLGLYVIALYVAIHVLDGYILVPLVQRRMVHLPPAVTLTAQLVLGILWGILGVAVATPLAGALMTLVRMAYVEDVLQKR